nr:MAG TPA: protein of unknown function (DUF4275) [Caudoviricetes sp.]
MNEYEKIKTLIYEIATMIICITIVGMCAYLWHLFFVSLGL